MFGNICVPDRTIVVQSVRPKPFQTELPALAGLLCKQFGETMLVCTEVEAWLLRSITDGAGVGGA